MSHAAGAIEIADPAYGFHATFTAPGMDVCAGYPAAVRDESACPTLSLPLVESFDEATVHGHERTARTVAVVYFARPPGFFFASVVSAPMRRTTALNTLERNAMVGGARLGLSGQLAPGVRMVTGFPPTAHDELTIHGAQVLRHVITLEVPASLRSTIRDRVLVYHVVGRAGIVTIFYRVFAADLAQAIAVGDAVAQTVTIDAPMNRLSTNRILVGALLVWAAVGGITVAVIKLRRRA